MKWVQVDRSRAPYPTSGTYKDWKPVIREHCARQCVYCAIPESRFGGVRNFHIEHYRPKGLKQFARLEDVVENLLYACSICNSFKGDDWPGDPSPDHSAAAYPNPCEHDYNLIFSLDKRFCLKSKYVSGTYVCERLALNRWQLVIERREARLLARLARIEAFTNEVIAVALDGRISRKALKVLRKLHAELSELSSMRTKLHSLAPYEAEDLSRNKRAS